MSRRLLLDVMLGKLATYLRMCGYDTAYALDHDVESDEAVLAWASDEGRTVVTRDQSLAAAAADSVLLETCEATDQLAEVQAAGIALELPEEPARCSRCNDELVRVGPDEPRPDYAPTAEAEEVWRCDGCGQYYWRGSHWEDVGETLAAIE